MAYLSNSEADFKEMLRTIGVDNFEQLIKNIPENLRFKGDFDLPEAGSEYGISSEMQNLAGQNKQYVSFLGAGAYDHYIPAIVSHLTSRPEFYTSYTPYQPEVSQGNLQAMYEFQSMICELTGMDVTNASMYEAGSALAEAVLLAAGQTRKNKIIIPQTLNPNYKEIVQTYTANMDIELVEVAQKNFILDTNALSAVFDDEVAAVVVQHPNYFGFLEDMDNILKQRDGKKSLIIQLYDPLSLGLLKTPGAYGVDIAVAEGQSLGSAQNFGGPFVGLFSVCEKLVRKIPGRISGMTKDAAGKQGFVLTLQTREQHIRREKATSNICTNSGLLALTAAIYLATLGKSGIRQIAELCLQKAHYLADELTKIPGVALASDRSYFKEFTIKLPVPGNKLIKQAMECGFMAGIDLKDSGWDNHLLIAVTEKRTKEELDRFTSIVKEILS